MTFANEIYDDFESGISKWSVSAGVVSSSNGMMSVDVNSSTAAAVTSIPSSGVNWSQSGNPTNGFQFHVHMPSMTSTQFPSRTFQVGSPVGTVKLQPTSTGSWLATFTAPGGSQTHTFTGVSDLWFKFDNAGNGYHVYYSSDGSSWTPGLNVSGSNVTSGTGISIQYTPGTSHNSAPFYIDDANTNSPYFIPSAPPPSGDTTPPAVPTITSVTNNGDTVTVNWNFDTDVALYQIFRGGVSQGTIADSAFSQTVSTGGTYSYTVRARDAAGNWSAQSAPYSFILDLSAPPVPTITSLHNTGPTVYLLWSASAGADYYEYYRNGVFQSILPASSTSISEMVANGTYTYTVRAGYSNGNWSAQSAGASITVNTTPATPPATPRIVSLTNDGSTVTVVWNIDGTVAQYLIYRDGSYQSTVSNSPVTNTGYNTVPADGTYDYQVVAIGVSGTWSDISSASSITVDLTPPPVPVISSVVSTGSSVTATWGASTGAVLYEVFRGSVSQGTTASTSFTQSITDGTYTYTVRAKDATGNWSAQSNGVSVIVDTVAPSVPTGLTAVQAAPGSRTVTVAWTASTGTPSGYRVYRDGVLVGAPTTNTFSDATVPSDGTHSYTVAAVDATGNLSSVSSAVSVVVDTVSPTTPTASSITSKEKSVTISWNSNTDIILYEIFRGGVSQGTTTSTTFTQTVPADGMYTYTIRGRDSAGNWSTLSSNYNITVQSCVGGLGRAPLDKITLTNEGIRPFMNRPCPE